MRGLIHSEFLHLWERGSGMHPLDRALLALGTALPETAVQALADWPLGRRNAALAELRRRCFGAAMQSCVECPRCAERMEFEMDARLLAGGDTEYEAAQTVVVNGRTFRLPTSRDLASVVNEGEPRRAALQLLERCCADPLESAEWSEEDVDEVGEQLALADPLAETLLALRCTACDNQWEEPLDIADFLWVEIEARARRLLLEVHALASAYGWREAEILSLSQARRDLYLEMVRA